MVTNQSHKLVPNGLRVRVPFAPMSHTYYGPLDTRDNKLGVDKLLSFILDKIQNINKAPDKSIDDITYKIVSTSDLVSIKDKIMKFKRYEYPYKTKHV